MKTLKNESIINDYESMFNDSPASRAYIVAMLCYVAYKLGEFVDVPIDIYNNSQYNT